MATGEKKIEGQPALGVKVSSDGHKDVRLYFDKLTNLLIAVERNGFDSEAKPVEQTDIYGSYREANGLKYPTKTLIKQNGKQYLESETIEFKPLEKVDSREFQPHPVVNQAFVVTPKESDRHAGRGPQGPAGRDLVEGPTAGGTGPGRIRLGGQGCGDPVRRVKAGQRVEIEEGTGKSKQEKSNSRPHPPPLSRKAGRGERI